MSFQDNTYYVTPQQPLQAIGDQLVIAQELNQLFIRNNDNPVFVRENDNPVFVRTR